MSIKGWTPAALVALGAIGMGSASVAAVGAGVAMAGSGGKPIHGCVAKSDGALRIVHSAHDCKSHEHSLSFNKRGPRGPRGPIGESASTGTFQMYANVDQNGHLGSNFDAVSAAEDDAGTPTPFYVVTFSHPIGSCAGVAQNGYAGGNLAASGFPTRVTNDPNNADAFDVSINENADPTEPVSQAFMLLVTCRS